MLVSLWRFATCGGFGPARELDRSCHRDAPSLLRRGGRSTNHRTLALFRVRHPDLRGSSLASSVAALVTAGFALLDDEDSGDEAARRARAPRQRADEERIQRAEAAREAALETLKGAGEIKERNRPKRAAKHTPATKAWSATEDAPSQFPTGVGAPSPDGLVGAKEDLQDAILIASSSEAAGATASEVRVEMADGGYRPASSCHTVVSADQSVILAVSVECIGSDSGLLPAAVHGVEAKYKVKVKNALAHGGTVNLKAIEALEGRAEPVSVTMPPSRPRGEGSSKIDRYTRLPGDSEVIGRWRERQGTEEGKATYRLRSHSLNFPMQAARTAASPRPGREAKTEPAASSSFKTSPETSPSSSTSSGGPPRGDSPSGRSAWPTGASRHHRGGASPETRRDRAVNRGQQRRRWALGARVLGREGGAGFCCQARRRRADL